jgi:hypothetical protein
MLHRRGPLDSDGPAAILSMCQILVVWMSLSHYLVARGVSAVRPEEATFRFVGSDGSFRLTTLGKVDGTEVSDFEP